MKISMGLLATTLAFVVLNDQAMAQDGDKPPTLNPLEIYTCNYLDGKGRGDLDKVISRWNKWTDANDPAPYTAWVMTPIFFGPEITFDLAWMRAWPTYADMGKSLKTWQDKGAKMSTEFFNVFSCDQHSSMAVLPMQPPVDEFPESSLVRFMDCKVDEGSNMREAMEAVTSFGKFMDSKGSETSAYVFFPGMGAGIIDFDYKLVLADVDFTTVAKDAEITMNGGGWQEAGKTFKGITSCDSARLYQADLIRGGGVGAYRTKIKTLDRFEGSQESQADKDLLEYLQQFVPKNPATGKPYPKPPEPDNNTIEGQAEIRRLADKHKKDLADLEAVLDAL